MEARDTVRDIVRGGKDGQKGPGEGGAATDGPRAAAGSGAAGGGGGGRGGGGVFALLAWSGALGRQAAAVMGRKIEAPPGERVREVGNPHIPVGTKGTGYSSKPPTSGEHYGSEAEGDV